MKKIYFILTKQQLRTGINQQEKSTIHSQHGHSMPCLPKLLSLVTLTDSTKTLTQFHLYNVTISASWHTTFYHQNNEMCNTVGSDWRGPITSFAQRHGSIITCLRNPLLSLLEFPGHCPQWTDPTGENQPAVSKSGILLTWLVYTEV